MYSKNVVFALVALLILTCSTILLSLPILLIGFIKLIPSAWLKTQCNVLADKLASIWSSINNFYINHFLQTEWEISGLPTLEKKNWYLIIANHQSWVDIVALQRIFNKKIPYLKFFLKDQLKWVPFLGFSWWAMGFPFMKRYSKKYLSKYPHKQNKDLLATQKSILQFKLHPTTIMNFVEGTRYSIEKKKLQQAPYQHLLKPKAGGISYVLEAMGEQLQNILDVTIVYSAEKVSLWNFLTGKIKKIKIHIRELHLPSSLVSPSTNQISIEDVRSWINKVWEEKDQVIYKLKQG